MVNRFLQSVLLLGLLVLTLSAQDSTSSTNQSRYFRFDLETQTKGTATTDPALVLPTGNDYAFRIESEMSVDLPGVRDSFLMKIDAAINRIIAETTEGHVAGRELLVDKGLKIDLLEIAAPSDIYLEEHTPILSGRPSDITNYHLIAIVDLKPLQAEIEQRWREVFLGERLVQYIMIASVVLILLFLLRGNQVMRSRETVRTVQIVVNAVILLATLAALSVIATMLHWV